MSGWTPTITDVWQARRALRGVLRRTPILTNDRLDKELHGRLFIKAEHLQQTGSFKIRGIYNRVRLLPERERERGILTASSGNAGIAAAFAALLHGIDCTVVMPTHTVEAKIEAVRALGARVVLHGRTTSEMFAKAEEVVRSKSYAWVHPFDQPEVIAGHGTIGLELLEEIEELDTIVVPTSGGGMLSGIATVVKVLEPAIELIGVQPEGAPGIRLSLAKGGVTKCTGVDTIADGLIAEECGHLNFEIIQRHADDVVLVSDDEILEAMRTLWKTMHMAVEPSGAAALAAVYRYSRFHGRRVAVVTSGANVDLGLLEHALGGGTARGWIERAGRAKDMLGGTCPGAHGASVGCQ